MTIKKDDEKENDEKENDEKENITRKKRTLKENQKVSTLSMSQLVFFRISRNSFKNLTDEQIVHRVYQYPYQKLL